MNFYKKELIYIRLNSALENLRKFKEDYECDIEKKMYITLVLSWILLVCNIIYPPWNRSKCIFANFCTVFSFRLTSHVLINRRNNA